MDREALIEAEPVLADLDRYLRTKHPAMPTLAALVTVRHALAHCPRCGKPHGGPGHTHTCTPRLEMT